MIDKQADIATRDVISEACVFVENQEYCVGYLRHSLDSNGTIVSSEIHDYEAVGFQSHLCAEEYLRDMCVQIQENKKH